MGPDEQGRRRRVPFDGLDDLPLRAARVGHQGRGRGGLGDPANVLGNPADRRAHHDDLGLRDPARQVGRGVVDHPPNPCLLQRLRVTPHPDNPRGEPARPEGQSDGAADQADTHDRDRSETHQD